MRKSMLAMALAGVLAMAGMANAFPVNPSLGPLQAAAPPLGTFVMGEAAAPNTGIVNSSKPLTAVQHVDWVVIFDGNPNGGFTYYYQIENSSVARLASTTINSGLFQAAGMFLSGPGGVGAAPDLDAELPAGLIPVPGGGSAPLPILTASSLPTVAHTVVGETEVDFLTNALVCCFPATSFNVDVAQGQVTFGFPELNCGAPGAGAPCPGPDAGHESVVLVGQGRAPRFVIWTNQGGLNTWNSDAGNCALVGANAPGCGEAGRPIPAPGVPEPASLLLLGSGLAGLGFWARRRQN